MSKNNGFGKFIVFCAAVFAAAAGVYYYLTKRDAAIADDFDDDDYDDFDDFEDDEDYTSEVKFGGRKYVDITSDKSDDEDAPLEEDKEADEEKKTEEFFNDEK